MGFVTVRLRSPQFGVRLWKILWDEVDTLGLLGFEPTNRRGGQEVACFPEEYSNKSRSTFHQMAQEIQRLTALAVSRLYADGAGLYLRIGRNGSKSWTFRFMLYGKARKMGLGGLHKVGLADAREKAGDARLLLSEGQDPLTQRNLNEKRRAAAEKRATSRSITFDQCAEAYIGAHEISWKNEKHRQQWRNTLATYVSPVFGKCSCASSRYRSYPQGD